MFIEPSTIAGWILAPLLAALVGYLLAVLGGKHGKTVAMERGMRALLRQQLFDIHCRYVQAGQPVPIRVKELATSIYGAYHDLEGNGTGTQMYQEIMQAKTELDN